MNEPVGYDYGVEKENFQTLVVITKFETSVQVLIGYGFEPKYQVSLMSASGVVLQQYLKIWIKVMCLGLLNCLPGMI